MKIIKKSFLSIFLFLGFNANAMNGDYQYMLSTTIRVNSGPSPQYSSGDSGRSMHNLLTGLFGGRPAPADPCHAQQMQIQENQQKSLNHRKAIAELDNRMAQREKIYSDSISRLSPAQIQAQRELARLSSLPMAEQIQIATEKSRIGMKEQSIALSQANQAIAYQNIEQAYQTLPLVTHQMEQATTDYMREQIQSAESMAQNAVELSHTGTSPLTVKMISDFARDTAVSINEFLGGVASGVYDGFLSPIEAAKAIYNNPTLITNLSNNIMMTFSDGPKGIADVAHLMFKRVSGAVYQFELTMAYGSAQERGHALGELGSNVVLSMAGAKATTAARGGLEKVADTLNRSGASEALGTSINQGMRASEILAPKLAEIDQAIQRIAHSSGGKVLQTIRKEAVVASDEGYTLFNKTSKLSNPVPENGIFARVVPQEFASKIKSGEIPLGKPNVHGEVFVAAYDDIKGLHPSELSHRLGLFADKAGTMPVDTSKFTVLKFKFTGDTSLLASPVEFGIQRGHNFLPGGKTSGQAREWIMDSNLNQRKMIEFIE